MSKNEIIAVTGMSGVGKDYLVERANEEYGITTINWGSVIGGILETDRDLMSKTHSMDQIEAAQLPACRMIVETQPAIVTCHTIRPLNDSYTYNLAVEQQLNPVSYVFVAAPPEIIVERVRERNRSAKRKTAELPVDEIDRIQKTKLLAMYSLRETLMCDLLVLDNTGEKLEENVQLLREQIGRFAILRP